MHYNKSRRGRPRVTQICLTSSQDGRRRKHKLCNILDLSDYCYLQSTDTDQAVELAGGCQLVSPTQPLTFKLDCCISLSMDGVQTGSTEGDSSSECNKKGLITVRGMDLWGGSDSLASGGEDEDQQISRGEHDYHGAKKREERDEDCGACTDKHDLPSDTWSVEHGRDHGSRSGEHVMDHELCSEEHAMYQESWSDQPSKDRVSCCVEFVKDYDLIRGKEEVAPRLWCENKHNDHGSLTTDLDINGDNALEGYFCSNSPSAAGTEPTLLDAGKSGVFVTQDETLCASDKDDGAAASSRGCVLDNSAATASSKGCVLDSSAATASSQGCVLDSSAATASSQGCVLDSSAATATSQGCVLDNSAATASSQGCVLEHINASNAFSKAIVSTAFYSPVIRRSSTTDASSDTVEGNLYDRSSSMVDCAADFQAHNACYKQSINVSDHSKIVIGDGGESIWECFKTKEEVLSTAGLTAGADHDVDPKITVVFDLSECQQEELTIVVSNDLSAKELEGEKGGGLLEEVSSTKMVVPPLDLHDFDSDGESVNSVDIKVSIPDEYERGSVGGSSEVLRKDVLESITSEDLPEEESGEVVTCIREVAFRRRKGYVSQHLCRACLLLFPTIKLLKEHRRNEHGTVRCQFCLRLFHYDGQLFKHLEEQHKMKLVVPFLWVKRNTVYVEEVGPRGARPGGVDNVGVNRESLTAKCTAVKQEFEDNQWSLFEIRERNVSKKINEMSEIESGRISREGSNVSESTQNDECFVLAPCSMENETRVSNPSSRAACRKKLLLPTAQKRKRVLEITENATSLDRLTIAFPPVGKRRYRNPRYYDDFILTDVKPKKRSKPLATSTPRAVVSNSSARLSSCTRGRSRKRHRTARSNKGNNVSCVLPPVTEKTEREDVVEGEKSVGVCTVARTRALTRAICDVSGMTRGGVVTTAHDTTRKCGEVSGKSKQVAGRLALKHSTRCEDTAVTSTASAMQLKILCERNCNCKSLANVEIKSKKGRRLSAKNKSKCRLSVEKRGSFSSVKVNAKENIGCSTLLSEAQQTVKPVSESLRFAEVNNRTERKNKSDCHCSLTKTLSFKELAVSGGGGNITASYLEASCVDASVTAARKRGRKPGSKNCDSIVSEDVVAVVGSKDVVPVVGSKDVVPVVDSKDVPAVRKRGRPPGSKNKGKPSSVKTHPSPEDSRTNVLVGQVMVEKIRAPRSCAPLPRGGSSKYPCPQEGCGKVMASRPALKYHVESHAGNSYSCDTCGKTFVHKINRKTHMLVHQEKHYHCKLCPMKFRMSFYLRRHIQEEHMKVLAYSCEVCREKFVRYRELQAHRFKHSVGKKYECDMCKILFVRRQHLLTHISQHVLSTSRNFMYHCIQCPGLVIFRSITPLRMHCRAMHPTLGEPDKGKCKLFIEEEPWLSNDACRATRPVEGPSYGKWRVASDSFPATFPDEGPYCDPLTMSPDGCGDSSYFPDGTEEILYEASLPVLDINDNQVTVVEDSYMQIAQAIASIEDVEGNVDTGVEKDGVAFMRDYCYDYCSSTADIFTGTSNADTIADAGPLNEGASLVRSYSGDVCLKEPSLSISSSNCIDGGLTLHIGDGVSCLTGADDDVVEYNWTGSSRTDSTDAGYLSQSYSPCSNWDPNGSTYASCNLTGVDEGCI